MEVRDRERRRVTRGHRLCLQSRKMCFLLFVDFRLRFKLIKMLLTLNQKFYRIHRPILCRQLVLISMQIKNRRQAQSSAINKLKSDN